jgi:hypothetical protein
MKYHQDMTRCIFRIFKTTKNDEGLIHKNYFFPFHIYILIITGEYTCQIDDDRGIKTSGYLYVEGI